MLGIPPEGTNDSLQFWIAFWPALYSGVIYSIVTGIVVGIVVLLFQRHTEKSAARRIYARELSILKGQIREAMSCPDTFLILSAFDSVPQPAKKAIEVVYNRPISLWREELSGHKALLDAIHELQLSYSEFKISADQLDFLLQQLARSFNSKRGAWQNNDQPLKAYILGYLSGFEPEALLPWLNIPDHTIPLWIDDGFKEANQNKNIQLAHAEYKSKRDRLQEIANNLMEKLTA